MSARALLSYKTRADAEANRIAQTTLKNVLNAWDRALRRDDCGAWRINGERGHIYTWADSKSWVLYVQGRSARVWSAAQKKLAFCRVTQNGDNEGCLRLFGLPTPEQAKAIREVVGIRRRTVYSSEALEAKQAAAVSARKRRRALTAGALPAEKSASVSSGLPQYLPHLPVEISAGNRSLSEDIA
jgi:hypothetical protein